VRKPEKVALGNLGLVAALAALPAELDRRMVGLQEPTCGESRFKGLFSNRIVQHVESGSDLIWTRAVEAKPI
jgi:hypothetical protein